MQGLTELLVRSREFCTCARKGQTMTEYAFIVAAIAVVVFVSYEVMGQDLTSLVDRVNNFLTSAS
jgi:Flp pilus assembly pilin Flp